MKFYREKYNTKAIIYEEKRVFQGPLLKKKNDNAHFHIFL